MFSRNKDFQEVTLEKEGEVVLRFAAVYGFRNIQNMILKLKKGKFPYHFVEVLACPGGEQGAGQACPMAVGRLAGSFCRGSGPVLAEVLCTQPQ